MCSLFSYSQPFPQIYLLPNPCLALCFLLTTSHTYPVSYLLPPPPQPFESLPAYVPLPTSSLPHFLCIRLLVYSLLPRCTRSLYISHTPPLPLSSYTSFSCLNAIHYPLLPSILCSSLLVSLEYIIHHSVALQPFHHISSPSPPLLLSLSLSYCPLLLPSQSSPHISLCLALHLFLPSIACSMYCTLFSLAKASTYMSLVYPSSTTESRDFLQNTLAGKPGL